MRAQLIRPDHVSEFPTPERCWILEVWNDKNGDNLSIARARVEPGVTTQLHLLRGVDERYLIVGGTGVAKIGEAEPQAVEPGTVVIIPAGVAQQITNAGDTDLIFYCICTPRFSPECYQSLE